MSEEKRKEERSRPPRQIHLIVRNEPPVRRKTSRLISAQQLGMVQGLLIALVVLLARVFIDKYLP